ncbi:glycosyltransferase family 2 protein [Paenibacillus sp. HJGM_3]
MQRADDAGRQLAQERPVALSIVVPAWNEAERLGATLQALRCMADACSEALFAGRAELVVVDDGSEDGTLAVARPLADAALRHSRRRGKGAALRTSVQASRGAVLLFADADLGESAAHLARLLEPLAAGQADMVVARFPAAGRRGGFGLVKRLAAGGIRRLSGYEAAAPLSGQRAVRRELLERIGPLAAGFGIEVGLTIDAVRLGYRVQEIELPLRHRETGRDWRGFLHRGRQFWAVLRTLALRWDSREMSLKRLKWFKKLRTRGG